MPTMWKQFLSKLPRKSSSKAHNAAGFADEQAAGTPNGAASGNPLQRTSSDCSAAGSAATSRSSSSSAVRRMSSAVFPSGSVSGFDSSASLKDVPAGDRQSLFISKVNICCAVFDFTDPDNSSSEKELKRQALLDLIDFVSSTNSRFTEPMILSCCKMFSINLFRVFPPNYRLGSSGGGEGDEEDPIFDPAWTHLQLVYELLLKFIGSSSLESKTGKKFFDHSFISRLLELFDSEDPRERECLKTILHRIYGKFMVHRPYIRKAVSNIFYRFVFETDRHNGVAELLEVFGSVISGFALPLKEEHKMFLWRVLVPLHKPKTVGSYLQQLTYCVTQFIEKDPKLASSVVVGVLRCWPVTNSQKEVMFLSELEEVLEAAQVSEFQMCVLPLFRRIACCINSFHFQVAERALLMLNNDHIMSLVAQNREAVIPLVLPALEQNSLSHWNQSVLNLTANVRKTISEMDRELFLACETKCREDAEKKVSVEETRRAAWERLEAAAAALQPVTGNTAVLVTPQAIAA